MKNSPLFLFLLLVPWGAHGETPAKKESLLNLNEQISEPLRKEQKEKKRLNAPKKASGPLPSIPPGKRCDPAHGDCLKNNPVQMEEYKNPQMHLGDTPSNYQPNPNKNY